MEMNDKSYIKYALAQAGLELFPPLIRESLLEDRKFRDVYGFTTNAVVTFEDSKSSFHRSELLKTIRSIFSKNQTLQIIDTNGFKWELKNVHDLEKLPQLILSCGEIQQFLPDFACLSHNQKIRLKSFEESAKSVNLPKRDCDKWRKILNERSLMDEEIDQYFDEFRNTPIHKTRIIRNEIAKGKSRTDSLIPNSKKYYERLVGVYDGSKNAGDYANGAAKILFRELSRWQPYNGFLNSLLLSSHALIASKINLDLLSREEVIGAFEYLDLHGDKISQIGAIEIGFSVLLKFPEIETHLISIIKQIRDDNIEGEKSSIKLLFALFVLANGELSRRRMFAKEPPFYRRLAALAQAGLIQRQAEEYPIDINSFCDWAMTNSGFAFYLQTFVDLRMEPRWIPDLASLSQFKAEFFGRIIIAGERFKQNIEDGELYQLVFKKKDDSLPSLSNFPMPFLPGPLEGADESRTELPSELSEEIERQLLSNEVKPDSFIALVNSCLIYKIDENKIALASEALKLANHRLLKIQNRSQLINVLNGLATVSAVARNKELAKELMIIVRRYRFDIKYNVSIEEALAIGLVAASSNSDLDSWKDFIGGWLTELSFGELKQKEAETLNSYIERLCHTVPELWISCGRANAALEAFLSI